MEASDAILKAYQLISTTLTDKFGQHGYQIVEAKEPEPIFGSRYTIWSNNKEMLRLTRDGKENLFLVEVSTDLPITALTTWIGISQNLFNPAYENNEHTYLITQVINSVS